MDLSNVIINYRRYLKRRNYSSHTVKNYLNTLRHYVLWLDVPIEQVTARKINAYEDDQLSSGQHPSFL
jgi:site-specific recombinase XerD